MTVNNNKGKCAPSTIHPNIPQGGAPADTEAAPSVVHYGKDDFKKGSKGRKINF